MKRLALLCAFALQAGLGATNASAEPASAHTASTQRALPPLPTTAPPRAMMEASQHARAHADGTDGSPFIVRTRSERAADGGIERWHTIELPVAESPSAGLHPVGNVAI